MRTLRTAITALFFVGATTAVYGRFLASANAEPAPATHDAKPSGAKSPTSFPSRPAIGTKARCSVSGDEFVVSDKTDFATYNGRTYAFCCPDCKPDFEKNPAKYAGKK